MEPARFDFEVLRPSMFRMIRSARSRLHRDSGSEDGSSSGAGAKNATSSASVSSTTSRWRSDLKGVPKKPTEQPSEQAVNPPQVKRAGTPSGTSRGRTSRLSRSSANLDQIASSENAMPEKQQMSVAPTAVLGDATNSVVLGDATNRYCTSYLLGQQRPVSASDAHPPKPTAAAVDQRFAQSIPTSITPPPAASDLDIDMIALQPDNPQHVAEYVQDIFQVLKREESLHLPSPTYMDRQVHVNAKMRAILVDWLVDVHKKYKLRPETLFLAVNLIDRFLEVQVTAQRNLQLVGVTALLIAAKFEEVYPPQIKEFVFVTDKAYSREDILKMEVVILKTLNFKICRPTAVNFLERYQSVNGCTDAHRDLAQYLLELTLVDFKMLKYAPSHLAAASILLSNKLLRRPSWTPAAVRHSKFTEAMLKECAKEMCVLLEGAENNPLQAVRKKFTQLKHHSVAKLNFHVAPGSQAGATATSARERRVSGVAPGRRSTGGAMDLA